VNQQTKKIILALILILASLLMFFPVLGQDNATETSPPEVPPQVIHGIWALAQATPIALFLAFVNCLAGYLSKTQPENFKLDNFIYTALISLVIGFLTIYAGWTYSMIQTWFANGFLTWYLWKVAKIMAKKFSLQKQAATTTRSGPSTQA
jgi:hypothetical protein